MNISICYDEAEKAVIATPADEINNENVRLAASKALELSREHDCRRILFDIRKCTIGQTQIEAFFFMKEMGEKAGFSVEQRIAIVYDPELYPAERAEFIENVVVNRVNPPFRMFTSMGEALRWLKRTDEDQGIE